MSEVLGLNIPASWNSARLKHVTTLLNRGSTPDYVDDGPVRVIGQAANRGDAIDWTRASFHRADSGSNTQRGRLSSGDLLINSTGTGTLGRVGYFISGVDHRPCIADTHITIGRTRADQLNSRYAYYWISSQPFQRYIVSALIDGSTNQIELNRGRLRDAPVPLPPAEEQRRIASYLDTELGRLASITDLRSASIGLIAERTIGLIERAVRGLHRYSGALKQAEYAPLGKIPDHWREGRLRSIRCEVQTGPFGSQLHASDYIEHGWPVINPANITPHGLEADSSNTVDDHTRERLSRHVLRRGDVVFGRRGELGRAAVTGESEAGWLCGTGCLRVRFDSDVFVSSFLRRFLSIPATRHYFRERAIGSTMPNLNSSILLGMPLLLPSISDQQTVADICNSIERSSSLQTSSLRRQLALLAEHRIALITAAVTGQFDVSAASGRGVTE